MSWDWVIFYGFLFITIMWLLFGIKFYLKEIDYSGNKKNTKK